MKCVKNTDGKIKRVNDAEAAALVKSGQATYVAKKEWKKEVRDKKPI